MRKAKFADFRVLFLPMGFYISAATLCLGIAHWGFGLGSRRLGVLTALGFFLWTLVEYLFHRFIYHHLVERSGSNRRIVTEWYNHRLHHDAPERIEDVVTQIPYSLPVALGVGLLVFAATRDPATTLAVLPGLLIGYLYYEWVHFSAHFFAARTPWTRWQRENHLKHHHENDRRRFGITSSLWDVIFRTI